MAEASAEDRIYETVIVGGGIAGLGCARSLHERGRDFVVVSKDLGGRIQTSADGRVNYGANVVFGHSENLKKHCTLLDKIRLRDVCFHQTRDGHGAYRLGTLRHAGAMLRFAPILWRFHRAMIRFRRDTRRISQKAAIERDPFLSALYAERAPDFVRRHRLHGLAEDFFAPHVWAFAFCRIEDMNAFKFMQILSPLATGRYLFSLPIDEFAKPFQHRILLAEIDRVRRRDDLYEAVSKDRVFRGRNVVLATGGEWALEQAGLDAVLTRSYSYLFHIQGKPHPDIAAWRYHVFAHPAVIATIMRVEHGAYLVFSASDDPPLEDYFSDVEIVGQLPWTPAGTVDITHLVDAEPRPGMYLIGGDLNVFFMEENLITGLYAADRICGAL
jgi:hypothetical protein